MKRCDAREAYYDSSRKTSDIVRTLALSAVAIVWVLRVNGPHGEASLARPLLLTGFLAVIALALDLLQYAVATAMWGWFHRSKEKDDKITEETEFEAPGWMNYPALCFFVAKVAALLLAYVVLLKHLVSVINPI